MLVIKSLFVHVRLDIHYSRPGRDWQNQCTVAAAATVALDAAIQSQVWDSQTVTTTLFDTVSAQLQLVLLLLPLPPTMSWRQWLVHMAGRIESPPSLSWFIILILRSWSAKRLIPSCFFVKFTTLKYLINEYSY